MDCTKITKTFETNIKKVSKTLKEINSKNFSELKNDFEDSLKLIYLLNEKGSILGFDEEEIKSSIVALADCQNRLINELSDTLKSKGYEIDYKLGNISCDYIINVDNTVSFTYSCFDNTIKLNPVSFKTSISTKAGKAINKSLLYEMISLDENEKITTISYDVNSLKYLENLISDIEGKLKEIEEEQSKLSDSLISKIKKDRVASLDLAYESLNFILNQLKTELENDYSGLNLAINKFTEISNILEENNYII